MNISIDDLKVLLSLAFDQGWNGHFDLKSECVDKILEEYLEKNKEKLDVSNLGLTLTTNVSNFDSNYYYYSAHSDTINGALTTSVLDDSII
jgi:hypothetical protein